MTFKEEFDRKLSDHKRLISYGGSSPVAAVIASFVALFIGCSLVSAFIGIASLFGAEWDFVKLFKSGWFPLFLFFIQTYLVAVYLEAKSKNIQKNDQQQFDRTSGLIDQKLSSLVDAQSAREVKLEALICEQVRAIALSYQQVSGYAEISRLINDLEAYAGIILSHRRGERDEEQIYRIERNYVMDRNQIVNLFKKCQISIHPSKIITEVPDGADVFEHEHRNWVGHIEALARQLLQDSSLAFPTSE